MTEQSPLWQLPPLARSAHASHCKRCLAGLPDSQTEIDASRLALAFYCIGSLDLLNVIRDGISEIDREMWKEWIWEQQTRGLFGSGFRPSSFMTAQRPPNITVDYEYDIPHIIMTYTALLSLAILRDDFSRLDRSGMVKFLRACQREDGSFSTVPGSAETDLRTTYCAFAISSMLSDWTGVDVERAVSFIAKCRSYEGGYGQSPYCEAQGGTTYTAVASLYLASSKLPSSPLTVDERQMTVEWLLRNQDDSGGFRGRTGKDADACYCFWCGAALKILGASEFVDARSLAGFLARCQFKYGGISKAPGEHPDPYHTYLSLAALSIYPPTTEDNTNLALSSWQLGPLDSLLNASEATAAWARKYIPGKST